jgi:hypothetical protein
VEAPLHDLSLRDIAIRFKKTDEFFFHGFEDGMLSFICDDSAFAQIVTFFPSPYAKLTQPCYIKDIIAAIDSNRFYSLKICF